jgi:hypothetical protein
VTVAPVGEARSSVVAVSGVAVAVGASLTAATEVLMVLLDAVQESVVPVPPLEALVMSYLVLLVVLAATWVARLTLESASRTVREPGVPWKFEAGTKRILLDALKMSAEVVASPEVGISSQSEAVEVFGEGVLEICQVP